MKTDALAPETPKSMPVTPTPGAKTDLKSLPMPDVEKALASSPEGIRQAEAQKRLTQYGPNEEAVFSGSIIRQGEIGALVYATGANTYFGKTAQLVQEAHTVSHFQRAVLKIGDYLILLAGMLVALIVAVALFRGDPIFTTLQFCLVLTVAAIPVAMPTVLSVTMAVGARLLARKAVSGRVAALRPAQKRLERDHRDRTTNGRERENGDG